MPRSGSTLIEQIVASHPAVLGGGERLDFSAAMADAGLNSAAATFPQSVATVTGAQSTA